MLLDENSYDEDATSKRYPDRAWAITVGICLLPVYLIFSAFGMQGRGTAAACSLGTLLFAAKMHSEKKDMPSFWIILSVLTLLNVLLVMFVPWPNWNYTLPLVAPIGIGDYLIMSLILKTLRGKTIT